MYVDKGLHFSTSLPNIPHSQMRGNQNFYKYPTNNIESNSHRNINDGNVSNNLYQANKIDMSMTSSTQFQPNQSLQSKKYSIAQSQIQSQDAQTYKFQFKRTSMGNSSSKPVFKQDSLNGRNIIPKKSGAKDINSSNIYSQFGSLSVNESLISNANSQNQKEKRLLRPQEYQKQIKDLENQLKFEEKYANDLYRTSEQAKRQTTAIKQEKIKFQERITNLQTEKNELSQSLDQIKKLNVHQLQVTQQLKNILQQKNERIAILQNIQSSNKLQIQKLSEKINNFTAYYRNELYQERIKQLNEQLISTNAELAQSVIEKNKLIQEIKAKNQRLMSINISSPVKSKENIIKSINISQKANEVISMAFQESIKNHQKDLQDLKDIIEQHNEDNRKLREQIVNQRKEIQNMKQQAKVMALKVSAQKNQINLQKQRALNDKANQIKTLVNKLNMLEQRHNKALKEINLKDVFLQEHLVGRAKDLQTKQFIQTTMRDYIQTFQSRVTLEEKITQLQNELQAFKNK